MEKLTRRGMMLAAAGAAAAVSAPGAERQALAAVGAFDVRNYGALGDGKTMNTAAIAQAVTAAAAAGGGLVYFPAGKYVTGAIDLRNNVTLHLAEGCEILGSPSLADYGPTGREYALIYGESVKNVAIVGRGAVIGRGALYPGSNNSPGRPDLVRFVDSKDILIENVHFSESARWGIHLQRCERVFVRGISFFNHVNYNNDGIDIDSSKDVAVTGCVIDTDDDAICLKSESGARCENIMIADCMASSHGNAIKFGTGSEDGFVNVTVADCTVVSPRYSTNKNGIQRGRCALALEIVDGGAMNRVTVSGLTIDGVNVPLFVRLGDRARAHGTPGTLKNVILSNIVATNAGRIGSSILGVPGMIIENVTLSDVALGYEGGGTLAEASVVPPELETGYPDSDRYGNLPGWGLYCRHVKGIKLRNLKLTANAADLRHAVVFDDAQNIEIDGLDAPHASGAAALVRLTGTRGALVRGCRPAMSGSTGFVSVTGSNNSAIGLVGNDLRGAAKPVDPPGSAGLAGNL